MNNFSYSKLALSLLIALMALTIACNKSDLGPNDKITLTSPKVDFTIVGGVQKLDYTATSELHIGPLPEWLRVVTLQEGERKIIEIEAKPSNDPKTRTVTVELLAGDAKESLVISQTSDPNGRPLQVLDSMALTALYYGCNGPGWKWPKTAEPWDLDKPFKGWHGVHTEVVDGQRRVHMLDLSLLQIDGELPSQITYLTNVNVLNLSGNSLIGKPLDILSKLPKLSLLDLSGNLLSDEITVDASYFKELIYLDLSSNRFTGALPESLSQLSNLRYLYLSSNSFTGSVPAKYLQLTNLLELDLSNNQLSGNFPTVLLGMTSLAKLDMANNSFSGTVPEQIANLSNIKEFNVSINNFSGEIPAGIGAMVKLELVSFANNNFTGRLPDRLGEILELKNLNCSNNKLIAVHSTIGRNAKLEYLDMSFNTIADLPVGFSQLENIATLFMNNNKIATMPDVSRLSKLSEWYADNNQLSALPTGIEKCVGMRELIVRNNQLAQIPAALAQMSWLEVLDLSGNKISSTLPEWFGAMPKLRKLHLADNNLIGTIPAKITNAPMLNSLNLSGNKMGGVLPSKILSDVRWKGETITVTSEDPPFLPVTITLPGMWYPKISICPQRGCGFTNCGFSHSAGGAEAA